MKIHIWFIINLAVIALLFYDAKLFLYPAFLVIYLSSFLLKKREEIKKEYNSPLPKKYIILVVGFIAVLLISAFTGLTEASNKAFWNMPWVSHALFIGLLCIVISTYVFLLRAKGKEIKS